VSFLIELVYFFGTLNYKKRNVFTFPNRTLREIPKHELIQKAQEAERLRIAADMHDELGSGITAIRLMSEIGKTKMSGNPLPELEKIGACADDLLNKMSAIIWSMDSAHDTLANLLGYIRTWSIEYFEDTAVDCKVFIPPIIPYKRVPGNKRRNIFLCVKESLNNAMKHAEATAVCIRVECHHRLRIEISDNGRGMGPNKKNGLGNGLRNMKNRMESVGGNFTIRQKEGTIVFLELNL
jgi:signal transduction histidine kinase